MSNWKSYTATLNHCEKDWPVEFEVSQDIEEIKTMALEHASENEGEIKEVIEEYFQDED